MNLDEDSGTIADERREEFPSFELECLVDETEPPATVTVFPASIEFDIHTNWITADRSSTVPLDEVR